jgi:hypothetical protein
VCVYLCELYTELGFRIGYIQELTPNNFELWSEDSLVGIVTSAVGWTRDREFACLQRLQTSSVTHPAPYLTGNGGLSSGVK